MITAKLTLLCIDDNAMALQIRKLVLESAGYAVLTATDSATAMRLFSSEHIDLVVSDHFLQRGTGTQLAALMKRLKPEIPIAIISGAVEPPEGMEYADLFICKTESPPEVLRQIAELLEGHASKQPPKTKLP